jgi:hypothetical protein
MKRADDGIPQTVAPVIAAFERAAIEFQNGGEPGVRLRSRQKLKAPKGSRPVR